MSQKVNLIIFNQNKMHYFFFFFLLLFGCFLDKIWPIFDFMILTVFLMYSIFIQTHNLKMLILDVSCCLLQMWVLQVKVWTIDRCRGSWERWLCSFMNQRGWRHPAWRSAGTWVLLISALQISPRRPYDSPASSPYLISLSRPPSFHLSGRSSVSVHPGLSFALSSCRRLLVPAGSESCNRA